MEEKQLIEFTGDIPETLEVTVLSTPLFPVSTPYIVSMSQLPRFVDLLAEDLEEMFSIVAVEQDSRDKEWKRGWDRFFNLSRKYGFPSPESFTAEVFARVRNMFESGDPELKYLHVTLRLQNVPLWLAYQLGYKGIPCPHADFYMKGRWELPEGLREKELEGFPGKFVTGERVYADGMGLVSKTLAMLGETFGPEKLKGLIPLGHTVSMLWSPSLAEIVKRDRTGDLHPILKNPLRTELHAFHSVYGKLFTL